jgi:predicted MPP superfamily phosphohydrolase
VRVETTSDAVRVRARSWEEGDREPDGWDVDSVDRSSSRIPAGAPGLYAEGPGVKQFAELSVSGYAAAGDWREPAGNDILRALRQSAGAGTPMILLSHDPDIFPDAAGLGIQLTLAGHTQGGQIQLPGLGPLITDTHLGRRFADGLVKLPGGQMFVTRGIGTTRIPVRFLCPPEASLISLKADTVS